VAELLDAAERLALRADLRRWTVALGATIAFLGVMGILRFSHKDALRLFNLDGERNIPAAFSGLLWVGNALLAFLIGRRRRGAALAWYALAALLALLAIDEVAEVHEHLQYYAGIDWQLLYLPLALVAGVAWVAAGRWLYRVGVGLWPFVGATICGLLAQPLEALQIDSHSNPRRGFRVMVVSEELLEMLAALLLGIAFLQALQLLSERRAR
jgi:hypothetical protein